MAKKPVKVKKTARQKNLPGMEDRAVKSLDNAAMDYADARDQRQSMTVLEVQAKQKVLDLMKAQKKTHYKHGQVEIELIPESVKVKVRIKEENENKPDDTGVEAVDGEEPETAFADAEEDEPVDQEEAEEEVEEL